MGTLRIKSGDDKGATVTDPEDEEGEVRRPAFRRGFDALQASKEREDIQARLDAVQYEHDRPGSLSLQWVENPLHAVLARLEQDELTPLQAINRVAAIVGYEWAPYPD